MKTSKPESRRYLDEYWLKITFPRKLFQHVYAISDPNTGYIDQATIKQHYSKESLTISFYPRPAWYKIGDNTYPVTSLRKESSWEEILNLYKLYCLVA